MGAALARRGSREKPSCIADDGFIRTRISGGDVVVRMSSALATVPRGAGGTKGQSCDHEKSSGWLEKPCFAAASGALYFHGSARDISLVQQAQEHEK
jgi:hypothetical protein